MDAKEFHKLAFSVKLMKKVETYFQHMCDLFNVHIEVVDLPKKDESNQTIVGLEIVSENSDMSEKCWEYVSNLKHSSTETVGTHLRPEIVKMFNEFIIKVIEYTTCVPTKFEDYSGSHGFKFMGSNSNIKKAISFVEKLHQEFDTGEDERLSKSFFQNEEMIQDHKQFLDILNMVSKEPPNCLKEISPRFAHYLMVLRRSSCVELLNLDAICAANSYTREKEMVDMTKEPPLLKRPDSTSLSSSPENAALRDDSPIHAALSSSGQNETDPNSPGNYHLTIPPEISSFLSFLDSDQEQPEEYDHGWLPKMPDPDQTDTPATANLQGHLGQENNKAPTNIAGGINPVDPNNVLHTYFQIHVVDHLRSSDNGPFFIRLSDFFNKYIDHFALRSLDFKDFGDYILNYVYPQHTNMIGYDVKKHHFFLVYSRGSGISAVDTSSPYRPPNFNPSPYENFTQPFISPAPQPPPVQHARPPMNTSGHPGAAFYSSIENQPWSDGAAANDIPSCSTWAPNYDQQQQLNHTFNTMTLSGFNQQQAMMRPDDCSYSSQQQPSFASVANKSLAEAARQHQLKVERSNTRWETRRSDNIRFDISRPIKRPAKLPVNLAARNGCDASALSDEELLEGVVIGCREGDERRRPIIIDACNIAYLHGNQAFSSRGIAIVVCYFYHIRKHKEIIAYMPKKKYDRVVQEQPILETLHKIQVLHNTPDVSMSATYSGRSLSCYDDRYLLDSALEHGGVVVSNDKFSDLFCLMEYQSKRNKIRTIGCNFVNDKVVFPSDPCGRDGPDLDSFLSFNNKEKNKLLVMQKYKPPKREKTVFSRSYQPAHNSALANYNNQQQASVFQHSTPPALSLAQQSLPSIASAQHFPPVASQQQQHQASLPMFESHWDEKKRQNFIVLKSRWPQNDREVRDFLNNENYFGIDDVEDLDRFLADFIKQVVSLQCAG